MAALSLPPDDEEPHARPCCPSRQPAPGTDVDSSRHRAARRYGAVLERRAPLGARYHHLAQPAGGAVPAVAGAPEVACLAASERARLGLAGHRRRADGRALGELLSLDAGVFRGHRHAGAVHLSHLHRAAGALGGRHAPESEGPGGSGTGLHRRLAARPRRRQQYAGRQPGGSVMGRVLGPVVRGAQSTGALPSQPSQSGTVDEPAGAGRRGVDAAIRLRRDHGCQPLDGDRHAGAGHRLHGSAACTDDLRPRRPQGQDRRHDRLPATRLRRAAGVVDSRRGAHLADAGRRQLHRGGGST